MPQRYADIAARDIALPIGGGQTAPPPSTVAAMIEALELEPAHRVLEIGSGSGYATRAARPDRGGGRVAGALRSLAVEAGSRLAAFGLDNVAVRHADGLAPEAAQDSFDRVLVHALIDPPAPRLTRWLALGGALIAAIVDEERSASSDWR